MRYIPIILLLFLGFSGFSQDTTRASTTRALVNIKHLHEQGLKLTRQDSLSFKIIGSDTLVPVENIAFLNRSSENKSFPYEPRDDEFLNIYKDVVFGRDSTSTLKIWKEGIKLYFEPGVPESHQLELKRFAARISIGIDSLKINEVKDKNKANYIIFYRQQESDLDPEPRISNENNSGYYLNWNGKQELNQAMLKINTYMATNEKYQFQLLKYHFFKTLGYFSNSPQISCESYLSNCKTPRRLTSIDLEILKYHYSYGMYKGINQEDFEKIHKNNKEILAKDPNAKIRMIHQN